MASTSYESLKEKFPQIKQSIQSGYEKLKEHAPKFHANIKDDLKLGKKQVPDVKKMFEKGFSIFLDIVSISEQAPKVKEYFKDAAQSVFFFCKKLFV